MREVVAIRHQSDQPPVIDGTGTTEVFGLQLTPRDGVVHTTTGAAATAV